MELLGWIIWGMGCLFLLLSLVGLAKKKGRARRVFFILCTGAGLTLSCFTSFSKFHLLWILPLQFLLGLLLFGLWAGFALSYAKIKQRKPERLMLAAGEFPPFGPLAWDHDGWEGKIVLPAWAGFQSRGGAYGAKDSPGKSNGSVRVTINPAAEAKELTPTEAHCGAMRFQIEQGEKVVESVLAALLPYYQKSRSEWGLGDEAMPPVQSPEEFRRLIGLSQVHVLSHCVDGLAPIGLEFGCDWDDEHGLGIVVHRARVVDIGQADTAFTWQADEAQPS